MKRYFPAIYLGLVFWLLFANNLMGNVPPHELSIISPHRKSIQNEFIPKFKEHYKKTYKTSVDVQWIDQGGSENNLRFIRTAFGKEVKTSNIDIFWGGGEMTFADMEGRGYLTPYPLSPNLDKVFPAKVAGVNLKSPTKQWYATAMSSFGIFYNKFLLKMLKKPEPHTWEDLQKPEYYDQITMADPRHSASSLLMFLIMLEMDDWDSSWRLITGLAGNTNKFTHSSSDPIKAVITGATSIATSIDFYAYSKINEIGEDKLGFALPQGKTIVNADPIAILKGAPNLVPAQRFIEYVLSPEAQRMLILKKTHSEGPRFTNLSRMAVNPLAYKDIEAQHLASLNPFTFKPVQFDLAPDELTKRKRVLKDLIGSLFVDLHSELRKSWQSVYRSDWKQSAKYKSLTAPPITEKEFKVCLEKWDDHVFRNKTIIEWTQKAAKKYTATSA